MKIERKDIFDVLFMVGVVSLLFIAYYIGMHEREAILTNCMQLADAGCSISADPPLINCTGVHSADTTTGYWNMTHELGSVN